MLQACDQVNWPLFEVSELRNRQETIEVRGAGPQAGSRSHDRVSVGEHAFAKAVEDYRACLRSRWQRLVDAEDLLND
jgi:hypothetical protein